MQIARLEQGKAVPGDMETFMRVYPMGFIPAVKETLMQYAQESLSRLQPLSAVTTQLAEALQGRSDESGDLSQIFELVRILGQGVQDGVQVSQEELEFITHALHTDEELAVIFAKISRNPGSFRDIARSVTEEGAAKFHEKWVVSVEGYGHASVAEHAVLHLAVENVPSLDGDCETDNRLASFTEFSARFKGRQDVGWFIPDAVARDPRLLQKCNEVHLALFGVHDDLFEKGKQYIATEEAKLKHPGRKVKDKTIADQFKNLMPASRLTSIGVTMNAREAENTIRKMLSAPYESVQEMGKRMKEASLQVAPTLVKYANPSEYLQLTRDGLVKLVENQRWQGYIPEIFEDDNQVRLLDYDRMGEEKIIAAALFSQTKVGSFRELMDKTSNLTEEEKRKTIAELLDRLGRWDVPGRALEFINPYLVEINTMTYGDWREAKRHRMLSYLAKDLHVQYGYMIPPLAFEMDQSANPQFHGCAEQIRRVMGSVEDLFVEVEKIDPYSAQYAVTRFHYRPAIMQMSLREGFHFIPLRTGPTAHPFIRRLAWPVFDRIREVHPLLTDHLKLRLESEGRPDRNFHYTY